MKIKFKGTAKFMCISSRNYSKKKYTSGYGINKLRIILRMWTLTANKNISYLIIFFFVLTTDVMKNLQKLTL